MQTDRKILPDAKSLIESLRSIGYNFESAIADLIDNSISAYASRIDISFDLGNHPYLSILDNGTGMSEEKLYQAMKFGSQNPNITRSKKDLGRFGLGLKSASLSQCREFIVVTKQSDELTAASWDLDYISEVNDWKIKIFSIDDLENMNFNQFGELKKLKTGTMVLWRKFDRLFEERKNFNKYFLEKIETIQNHLSLIFHRFLQNENELIISINNNKVIPVDPFLKANLATQKKETQIKTIEGEKIKVTPYVLPHLNKMTRDEIASLGGKVTLKQNQGYYIYRNKRLIIWGKWFNQYPKTELAKLVRVQVDIPNSLDYLWEIDVKKSQAVIPSQIRKNLGMMINESLNSGRKVIEYRGKIKNRGNLVEVWNRVEERDYIRYSINQSHPLIEALIQIAPKNKDLILKIIRLIENNIPSYDLYIDEAQNNKKIYQDNEPDSSDYQFWIDLIDTSNNILREIYFNNLSNLAGIKLTEEEVNKLREYIKGRLDE